MRDLYSQLLEELDMGYFLALSIERDEQDDDIDEIEFDNYLESFYKGEGLLDV